MEVTGGTNHDRVSARPVFGLVNRTMPTEKIPENPLQTYMK